MTVFFTSDTHFGHEKVIGFCNRPFETVERMDDALIRNWNDTVAPTDHVYHLGDVIWHGSKKRTAELLGRLNGTKTLITGNHDHKDVRKCPLWQEVTPLLELKGLAVHVTLCHYPLAEWAGRRRGGVHFHGHMHGTRPPHADCIDVGVDAQDMWFRPQSLEELLPRVKRETDLANWLKDEGAKDGR